MVNAATANFFGEIKISARQILFGFAFVLCAAITLYAQSNVSLSTEENTLTIGDAHNNEIYSFGKTVIVEKSAKGVLSFGGDIIIEGRIEGDVAAIGGNIIQKENAFVGGDVIVFGGTYRAESQNPLRGDGKETVMVAMFEEELRDFTQHPTQIFSPNLSVSFFAQRLLSVLFWFVIALAVTTLAPGAVSRAVARFQHSTLKVVGIGLAAVIVTLFSVIVGLSFLPNYISAIASLMVLIMLLLSYVFGHIALQVSFGKLLQKRFLPENKQSETVALLLGSIVWTILLSLPYLWIFALLTVFAASLGLVLTARSGSGWQKLKPNAV